MKKLSLKPKGLNQGEVLTRAQLKKVMGGLGSTPEGCIVYSMGSASDGSITRTFTDEYGDEESASSSAANYATSTGGRYGYDCPPYDHDYIWS